MRYALLCLLLVPFMVNAQEKPKYQPPRTADFGIIGIAMKDDLTVTQGGARAPDGKLVLEPGDKLLKWNGEVLKDRDTFCRNLYATKPGEVVEIKFERKPKGEPDAKLHTAKVKLGDRNQLYADIYKHLDKRKRTFDWREQESITEGGPLREKLLPLWPEYLRSNQWEDLLAANKRELDLWNSLESTTSCELLLSDPLSAHLWLQLTTEIMAYGEWGEPVHWLRDREPAEAKRAKKPDAELPKDPKERAKLWWGEFLSPLDVYGELRASEEFSQLLARANEFTLSRRGEPGFDEQVSLVHAMREMQADFIPAPSSISFALRALGYQEFVKPEDRRVELPEPMDVNLADFVEGDAVCYASPYGLVAIGGEGRNVWKGGPKAPAVIIDVGGDDEYVDCATTRFGQAMSIVVDKAGNDTYRATGNWGIAAGVLGVAVIADWEGDDTYHGGDWSIGTAFGGTGLLFDSAGSDRYLGKSNCIGCAAYGVGGVYDMAGRDSYDAHSYSIGVGHPGGVGFVLDTIGDDTYRCGGVIPSPYGTKGEYLGMGIGCGFGWRGLASGGIGLVVDVAGNDVYDAGEFGLGCGYYLGVGAVRDMAGDDIYHSSRYGLAAAAHCAVGLFMDDSGRDTYEGKTAASMAGAWDIATCYFYDGAGDDTYRCDSLGLGGASQNAVAIFWDAGGNDVYRGGNRTIAEARGTDYAAGRLAKNFGIFIDSGGKDVYPNDTRANGQTRVANEYEVFIDE
jgi:hypothetical protein